MADPTGESKGEALRLDFDRWLMLQFAETENRAQRTENPGNVG